MTERMDALLSLSQNRAMNTELAKRMEAHRAACRDITADPLVAMAIADAQAARDVMARWKANRERPAPPPVVESVKPYVFKRQAE